jgi:hypothetical protein
LSVTVAAMGVLAEVTLGAVLAGTPAMAVLEQALAEMEVVAVLAEADLTLVHTGTLAAAVQAHLGKEPVVWEQST